MRLWRYCLAGLVYDLLFFMVWLAVPVQAERLGASAFELALLQTASTVVYVVVSFFSGRLADRWPKPRLMALGCAGILIWAAGLALGDSMTALFCMVPVGGLASALFWPGIQGSLGAETPPERMDRALGIFNVTWSLGKALGFLVAGELTRRMDPSATLWIAAALAVPTWALLPRDERPVLRTPGDHRGSERAVFRTLGYIANFAAFGAGAAFQNQYYKYLKSSGLAVHLPPETFFGVFLAAVFMAQTISFWLLQRGEAWAYRRGLLYASQLVLAAGVLGVAAAESDLLVLALAPIMGAGLGFSYASSIYYSLHGPAEHGRYAGLHEAVLGAGTFLIPLIGGALADATLDLRFPYWVAAAAVFAAIVLEEAVYRRSSRS